jgi:uncharacterized protein (DUF433 family)
MQAIPTATHPRIVRDPDVVGGAPTIKGTRVPVRAVACVWRATGDRALIRRNYPRLTEDDVEAAIRCYEEHRAKIDAGLLAEERASD